MFGVVVAYILAGLAILAAVWFVVCIFMEPDFIEYDAAAAFIAVCVALFFFVCADAAKRDLAAEHTPPAVVATEYESEV